MVVPRAAGGRSAVAFTWATYAVLQGVRGVELVEDVRLFAANPITGEHGDAVQQIDIDANALVFSYEHQVRVVEATRGSSRSAG